MLPTVSQEVINVEGNMNMYYNPHAFLPHNEYQPQGGLV